MSDTHRSSLYEGRRAAFAASLETVQARIARISFARISVAVVFLLALYFGFNDYGMLLYTLPVWVYVFVRLVLWHSRAFDEKVRLENLININNREVKAQRGVFQELAAGTEFIDHHHPYAHDLDLFGEGSIFQYTNRCNTLDGKRRFAASLTTNLPTAQAIEQQQQSTRELTEKIDFRQNVEAEGMEIQELPTDRKELRAWLRSESILYHKPYMRYVLWILPAATIAALLATIFLPVSKIPVVLLAFSQWVMLGMYARKINAFHEYISKKKYILDKYARMLHLIAKEPTASTQLAKLSGHAREAETRMHSLASLVSALNARLNFMTSVAVNSFLLYDLQCVYRLEKWKADHAPQLETWLDTVSETEVLCSWGTFAFNHPSFTYPTITTELTLSATALGHPLLRPEECVTNDVLIGRNQRIQLITGANMAGKSTFLRTVGVNYVLALAGVPVCAKQFTCAIANLRSGMRTADSLKDHQSYFYAELDRLKSIMDELRQDKPLLVLLDEILKGTNSTDKLAGSIAMVRQLIPHPCLALIATHDLALGELEKEHPDSVKNFCFEANIENDQLFFDYKLKNGLAQKMNATFLMKKMGIIPR
jgi:hypothetical protein